MSQNTYTHPLLNKRLPTIQDVEEKCGDAETRAILRTACHCSSYRYTFQKSIKESSALLTESPYVEFDHKLYLHSPEDLRPSPALNEVDLLRASLHHRWDIIEELIFYTDNWLPSPEFFQAAEHWSDLNLHEYDQNLPDSIRTGWARRWALLFQEKPEIGLNIKHLLSSTITHVPGKWSNWFSHAVLTNAEITENIHSLFTSKLGEDAHKYEFPSRPPLTYADNSKTTCDSQSVYELSEDSTNIIPLTLMRLPILMEKYEMVPSLGMTLGFFCQLFDTFGDLTIEALRNRALPALHLIEEFPNPEESTLDMLLELFFVPPAPRNGLLISSPFFDTYKEPFSSCSTYSSFNIRSKVGKIQDKASSFFDTYIGGLSNLEELCTLHFIAENLTDTNLPDVEMFYSEPLFTKHSEDKCSKDQETQDSEEVPKKSTEDAQREHFLEYQTYISDIPRPSQEQIARFASHVSYKGHWGKHLFPYPKVPFFFYLDPTAGMQKTTLANGRAVFQQITEKNSATSLTTEEYRKRFGYLHYWVDHGGKALSIMDGQGFTIPPALMQAGRAELSSFLSPCLDFSRTPACTACLNGNENKTILAQMQEASQYLDQGLPENLTFLLSLALVLSDKVNPQENK